MFQIEKELKGANLPRTIRFTEVLFEKLGQTAQQSGISFNLLVLQCCRFAWEQMERKEMVGGDFPKQSFYDIMAK